jgi:hypothetical protein
MTLGELQNSFLSYLILIMPLMHNLAAVIGDVLFLFVSFVLDPKDAFYLKYMSDLNAWLSDTTSAHNCVASAKRYRQLLNEYC